MPWEELDGMDDMTIKPNPTQGHRIMTKPTPEQIIDDAAREAWCSMRTHHEHIMEALTAAGYVIVDQTDIRNLDAVVKALGIEDSHITPAEKVEELIAEIERLDAMIQQDTGS